jgi:hypothetical protein
MKLRIYIALGAMLLLGTQAALAHGGGCRKAYLPQCCHMDNSTGSMHCH